LITVPFVAENKLDARGYGVEVSAAWSVVDSWLLGAGYTLMLLDIQQDNSLDPTAQGQEKDTPVPPVPRALACRPALALRVRHGSLLGGQRLEPGCPRLRPARRPTRLAPAALARAQRAGQNLAQTSHNEFGPSFTALPTSIPRASTGR
jgi:outer membrane receptor protein involved in Fe transport